MIPYDKRSGKIWFNGELVDWADAKIHVLKYKILTEKYLCIYNMSI